MKKNLLGLALSMSLVALGSAQPMTASSIGYGVAGAVSFGAGLLFNELRHMEWSAEAYCMSLEGLMARINNDYQDIFQAYSELEKIMRKEQDFFLQKQTQSPYVVYVQPQDGPGLDAQYIKNLHEYQRRAQVLLIRAAYYMVEKKRLPIINYTSYGYVFNYNHPDNRSYDDIADALPVILKLMQENVNAIENGSLTLRSTYSIYGYFPADSRPYKICQDLKALSDKISRVMEITEDYRRNPYHLQENATSKPAAAPQDSNSIAR